MMRLPVRKFLLPFPFVLVLALSLPVLGQGTTGTVQGTVTDEATGQPIPAVNIVLLRSDGSVTRNGAFTAADGSYTIINTPPGRFTLRAAMLGYKIYEVQGLLVTVGVTTRQDFRLEKMSGAVIHGTVGVEGQPDMLAGAIVLLLDSEGKPTPYRIVSKEAGLFVLSNIPPGNYTLQVSHDGYYIVEIKEMEIRVGSTVPLNIHLNPKVPTGRVPPPR
jgi:hypothetical protein